jgi:hypothetical protein
MQCSAQFGGLQRAMYELSLVVTMADCGEISRGTKCHNSFSSIIIINCALLSGYVLDSTDNRVRK